MLKNAHAVTVTECMMSFTSIGSTFAEASRMPLNMVLAKDLMLIKAFWENVMADILSLTWRESFTKVTCKND